VTTGIILLSSYEKAYIDYNIISFYCLIGYLLFLHVFIISMSLRDEISHRKSYRHTVKEGPVKLAIKKNKKNMEEPRQGKQDRQLVSS